MPLTIIRQSIIDVDADAIVNTANPHPAVGGGTDTAVYTAAGWDQLLEARQAIGDIQEGDAAVTPAFDLPYKVIIHAVSPVWIDGEHNEKETLRACYTRALALAEENGCESVGFPLLASGSNGFPKDVALKIALRAIQAYLMEHEMNVILAVFDKTSFELSARVQKGVAAYIRQHQVDLIEAEEYSEADDGRMKEDYCMASVIEPSEEDVEELYRRRWDKGVLPAALPSYIKDAERPKAKRKKILSNYPAPHLMDISGLAKEEYCDIDLSDITKGRREDTFQVKLLHLIDESGETDPVIYKRANIDRKLFAKIRKDENYKPSRKTAIALAIALKLNLTQTQDLLQRAGFSISFSTVFDLIIRYCLNNRIWNINDVNAILFEYDQETL